MCVYELHAAVPTAKGATTVVPWLCFISSVERHSLQEHTKLHQRKLWVMHSQ